MEVYYSIISSGYVLVGLVMGCRFAQKGGHSAQFIVQFVFENRVQSSRFKVMRNEFGIKGSAKTIFILRGRMSKELGKKVFH